MVDRPSKDYYQQQLAQAQAAWAGFSRSGYPGAAGHGFGAAAAAAAAGSSMPGANSAGSGYENYVQQMQQLQQLAAQNAAAGGDRHGGSMFPGASNFLSNNAKDFSSAFGMQFPPGRCLTRYII